jgi:hypothetical protein
MKSIVEKRIVTTAGTLAVILFLIVVGFSTTFDAKAKESLKDLVQQSRFIFVGTITQLRAVTVSSVPVSDNTIVVRIDELLRYAKPFAGYGGMKVTVQVKDPKPLSVGDQALFFTNVWILGESVAVQAVGYRKITKGEIDSRKEIMYTLQGLEDEALAERIGGAEFVVVGRVSSVRPAPETQQRHPISEHYPYWQEAVLEVASPLNGGPARTRLVVRCPGSTDIAFRAAPKFKVGQQGIWILRGDPRPGAPKALLEGKEIEAYMAQEPRDYQAKSQLKRIRQLIKQ